MRPRRLAFGLIAPAALLVLVGTLATLQYKWLGQVSEAERAQLRTSLDRRVQELADDFDRELGRAFRLFQLPAIDPDSAEPFARRHDEWLQTSRFPGLIRTAWYVHVGEGRATLFRYVPERRTLEAAEWPDTLAPVQARVSRQLDAQDHPLPGKTTVFFASSGSAVLPDVPAVIVPIPNASSTALPNLPGSRVGVMLAFHVGDAQVVLELDRAHLQDTVLPALAARHFPEDDRYRVAVVDGRQGAVYARGLDGGAPIDPARADASAALFMLRVEALREAMSFRVVGAAGRGGRGAERISSVTATPVTRAPEMTATVENRMAVVLEQRAGGVVENVVPAVTGWRVLVQHSAGSLDAAVANARRRNLWLSFGILAVLAASVGLIVANARRSERLAAQQMDFVATVSHELRTPLAVIRSAAQNLSAGVVHAPEQASRYGDLIESEGRRLTDMVEQVLEYAGLSGNRRPVRAAPVDCAALVRDVVDASRDLLAAERMDVEIDVAPGLPAVLADEGALRRALHNLITNALKYAADGRWLSVSARRGAGRGAGEVLLSVSDRGRGIAAEDLAHIFEPFYRGRYAIERQIHGNGLGLSLVKRIADAHGGRVAVRSTAEGTTFTLHVPAAPADAAVQPVGDSTADAGAAHG